MLKTADGLELSANVKVLCDAEEVLDAGMGIVIAAKDQLGLLNPGLRAAVLVLQDTPTTQPNESQIPIAL